LFLFRATWRQADGRIELYALVTGATGQLGREVVPRLLERGDHIKLLARDVDKTRKIHPDCEVIQGDITLDDLGLKQSMNLDAIYHLAADINLGNQTNDRVWVTNFQGTVNVVRFCQNNSVPHLFYAGTAYTEKGRNTYEKSKKAAEQFVDSSSIERKTIFKIGILVPAVKDAVNASTGALYQFVNGISTVLSRAEGVRKRLGLPRQQSKFRVKGIPEARLNLVHVDVVADFIVKTTSPGKYWLTHPNPTKLDDLADWVGDVLHVPIEFEPDFEMSDSEELFHRGAKPFLAYLQGDDFVSHLKGCSDISADFVKESVAHSIIDFKGTAGGKWVK
jgi:nucleoside-diphosphate-sugar epimerase